MKRRTKKIFSVILGISLSLMMVSVSAFAAAEPSMKVISGDGGTYTKGSGTGYAVQIKGCYVDDIGSVIIDGRELSRDYGYTVSGSKKPAAPTTSEAPATSEGPATSEVPATLGVPDSASATRSVMSLLKSIWSPAEANAATVDNEDAIPVTTVTTVTVNSSYMDDTLLVGEHQIVIFADGEPLTATVNVVDKPAAGSTDNEEPTDNDVNDDTSKSDDSKSDDKNSPRTEDTFGLIGFGAAAVISGAALLVLGRKKVFK